MDADQLAALLEAARARPETYAALVVMAMTGLRLGEAGALRWEDVDWKAVRIRVVRQLSGALKTQESEREVDAPPALLDLLRALRAERRQAAFREGREPSPWLLFENLDERPTRRQETRIGHQLRRDMDRALRAAQLPESFTPHSLRHTYASRLISDGGLTRVREAPARPCEHRDHA
jgi:integrase